MPLSHLEHFLLQTADMAKTRDWYLRVLGMRVGQSPDFKFPVCWLYLGDKDVVHVTEGGASVSKNRKRYIGQESQATSGTCARSESSSSSARSTTRACTSCSSTIRTASRSSLTTPMPRPRACAPR